MHNQNFVYQITVIFFKQGRGPLLLGSPQTQLGSKLKNIFKEFLTISVAVFYKKYLDKGTLDISKGRFFT